MYASHVAMVAALLSVAVVGDVSEDVAGGANDTGS